MSAADGPVINAFTVDLEDWYQGLEIDADEWRGFENRLEVGTQRLLDLLEAASVKATFFVLGYAAERAPQLIRRIAAAGHEIGTHGYGHNFVYKLGPEGFRCDLERSIAILQDILGAPVQGHRAPFFSITRAADWAFDVLRQCGIHYDSSIFPVYNYRYGISDAPRWIHQTDAGIAEFPLPTYRLGGRNIPLGGGAYFRLFPYNITAYGMRRINSQGHPVAFYIHPWELDPGQPRLALPRRIRLTHYWNLASTEQRLERLLREFRFTTMDCVLGSN